jgi:hypothetical protein
MKKCGSAAGNARRGGACRPEGAPHDGFPASQQEAATAAGPNKRNFLTASG